MVAVVTETFTMALTTLALIVIFINLYHRKREGLWAQLLNILKPVKTFLGPLTTKKITDF